MEILIAIVVAFILFVAVFVGFAVWERSQEEPKLEYEPHEFKANLLSENSFSKPNFVLN